MENALLKIINLIRLREDREPIAFLGKEISLRRDLGFDSLGLAQLTVMIEDRYEIDIFEDGIIDSVGDIIDKLNKG